MTAPQAPGIQINGPDQNVRFTTPEENLASGGPNPLAQPRAPVTAEQADPMAAFERKLNAQNAPAQVDPEQAALEAEHGKGETFGTQFARGALSALLAVPAIGAAQTEWYGKVLGIKQLEDFGRSVGRASTGRSALEAFHGAAALASGESAEESASIADEARKIVDEQERAWPLLSTGAQIAGSVAFGLGTGAGASGAAGLGDLAAVGAVEGAGTGAQNAYDVDAPLTEVWTSALLGGTLGAGLAAAPALGGKLISKFRGKPNLEKVFAGEGSFLGGVAEERAVKAVGMRGPELRKLGVNRAKQVGRDVLAAHLDDGTPVLPNNPLEAAAMDQAELSERLATALDETGQKLGTLRQKVSGYIDASLPEFRPRPADIGGRIEREVIEPLGRNASPGASAQAAEAADYVSALKSKRGESMSLEDLFQERLAMDKYDVKFNSKAPEVMNDVRRVLEDEIESRVAVAAKRAGVEGDYTELKRMFGSLKEATQSSAKAAGTDMGNRWASLSDNLVGAAMVAGDLASGGGLSMLKGVAAGVGHKFIREHGSAFLASLARRFSRTQGTADVAQAGGREAQDVLTTLTKAKKFMQETADRAGSNPAARASAENTAQEVVAAEMAKRAGKFDPATWATTQRAPSPLARVIYRSQILDTVSNDLAQTVEKSVAMRPSLDFDLDAGKLSRLVKDADGPDAIGAVQSKVREIADAVPEGDQFKPLLEASLERLNTADTAGALVEGHNVARSLAQSGDASNARALQLVLGDDSFGQAGRLYRSLTPPPDDALRALADPTKLRDSLRTLELRGQLTKPIADEHASTLAAYQARQKLTGEPIPDGVKKAMMSIEDAWSRGEEAATLDGARLGRVKDAIDNMTESRVASRVPQVPEAQQVQATIQEALKGIDVAVRRSAGRNIVNVALRNTAKALTPAARLDRYEQRLDQLSQAVVAPDPEQQTAAVNEAPPGARQAVATAKAQKLQTLMSDMPKPRSGIHGTAYDSLSSAELRQSEARWDATMDPLSVFEDFKRGDVDPEKVSYAWKQYPGLQRMAQLGTLDILQNQMSPDDLDAIPDSMLTQLDYLLGFNGGLQSTISVSFSQRMDAVGDSIRKANGAAPTPPSRGLQLPTAKPTHTQRIAGAQ